MTFGPKAPMPQRRAKIQADAAGAGLQSHACCTPGCDALEMRWDAHRWAVKDDLHNPLMENKGLNGPSKNEISQPLAAKPPSAM
jgi:hypothetical protein